MSDVYAKINRLVALAGSPNENEARNAAYFACKLMRDHKVIVGGFVDVHAPTPAAPESDVSPPPWVEREEAARREARRAWYANWEATFSRDRQGP